MRIDGFVSVDAGTLTTKLLSFSGNDLYLNAIGPVTVSVLNPGGKVLGSQTVSGDALMHHVLFDGQKLSTIIEEPNIRLQFNIGEGGKLYSFTVQP